MITALGIMLNLALNKLAKALAFIVEHWNVFLPMAIVLLGLWKINSLTNERDAAIQKHHKYLAKVKEEMRLREKENAEREGRMLALMEAEKAEHAAKLDELRRNYNALQKDKESAVADARSLRERLRQQLTEAANGLPGSEYRLVRPAEGGGDCNATDSGQGVERYLNNLEYAAAITTLDYNTLWERCNAVNIEFGGSTSGVR